MITINITRDELCLLAADAIRDIDVAVHHDANYEDGDVGGEKGWTAEDLVEARAEVLAPFDRAIELVRAWEEAED